MQKVNNAIYEELGERWYTAQDDPVALLRAEASFRDPWVLERIKREKPQAEVLDVGCGAGFLSNRLALEGHRVTGLDASAQSLEVARSRDATGCASYVLGDAGKLPFADASFDTACAMDFLEHVEDPGTIVREIARTLKPGGLFFFHTYSRNPLSWLLCIKAVEWFVRNTPRHMHVYHLFITPREMKRYCEEAGLIVEEMQGSRPVLMSKATLSLLATGAVPPDFTFKGSALKIFGYFGMARKV